jgi:hypothetical protein
MISHNERNEMENHDPIPNPQPIAPLWTENRVEIGYLSLKHVERNLIEEVELNENTTSRFAGCCYRSWSGNLGDSDAKERVIVVSKHEFSKRGVKKALEV